MSTAARISAHTTERWTSIDVPQPPAPHEWHAYLSEHAKSFWAASRLMPAPQRNQLAGVYAYCRYTDDLVDRASCGRDALLLLLDEWERVSRDAYDGAATGVALLDSVMPEMARHHVPFEYAAGLLRGMRQDVRGTSYASMIELRHYCYNVASVVGLWLTELFGVHDAGTLERAAELGIAMQLTNIVRDVGEDCGQGRFYLPQDLLAVHGITPSMIDGWTRERSPKLPPQYRDLLEDVMHHAEAAYQLAEEGIPRLPSFFRPAVSAASRLYRGIHDVIRSNGYDNITRRAVVPDAYKRALVATLRA